LAGDGQSYDRQANMILSFKLDEGRRKEQVSEKKPREGLPQEMPGIGVI